MKVYCNNCKYVKNIKTRIGVLYYCNLPERIISYASRNLKYNCNFYKKKWWKFWIKENRRTLIGYPSKTDARIKPNPKLVSYIGNTKAKKEVI